MDPRLNATEVALCVVKICPTGDSHLFFSIELNADELGPKQDRLLFKQLKLKGNT